MTRHLVFMSVLLLAGCNDPFIQEGNVIRRAADPAYAYDDFGRVQAVACNIAQPSGYSSAPSACQRDVVFARQIARPSDLVDPRNPGPAPAGPVGRAADRYIGGTAASLPAGSTSRYPSRGAVIYPTTPADPYYGG
ncbi:MAG: hypothetical protein Q4G24_08820 [Paracoccus sp. (in: a-proteobacteria)]|uniref:hypothetical protein n=1 Tax=Paracoccus sp. TaxID=267 RepID=UPI0026DF43DD|nr:hypothetical protein [Paracoccus sp. (in: a-proteobacteria)]MDO5621556.1 hypothetical protein [Paracoccus sp. (in: a-proteobacteria)]